MDFDRSKNRGSGAPWAGLAATALGVGALTSQLLCCVPGVNVVAWLLSSVLTAGCLLSAIVGIKQGRQGGDVQALAIVGLILGLINGLILLAWLAMQLGVVSLVGLALLGDMK